MASSTSSARYASSVPPRDPHFKIMTYNVSWEALDGVSFMSQCSRPDGTNWCATNMAVTIAIEMPDLLTLQEIRNDRPTQWPALHNLLELAIPHFNTIYGWEMSEAGTGGVMTLYKREKLTPIPELTLKGDLLRASGEALPSTEILRTPNSSAKNGRPYLFMVFVQGLASMNVHFPHAQELYDSNSMPIFSVVKDMLSVIHHNPLPANYNVTVSGDFNTNMSIMWDELPVDMQFIRFSDGSRKRVYAPADKTLFTCCQPSTTSRSLTYTMAYDHILTTFGFADDYFTYATTYQARDDSRIYASDHVPVVAVFHVPPTVDEAMEMGAYIERFDEIPANFCYLALGVKGPKTVGERAQTVCLLVTQLNRQNPDTWAFLKAVLTAPREVVNPCVMTSPAFAARQTKIMFLDVRLLIQHNYLMLVPQKDVPARSHTQTHLRQRPDDFLRRGMDIQQKLILLSNAPSSAQGAAKRARLQAGMSGADAWARTAPQNLKVFTPKSLVALGLEERTPAFNGPIYLRFTQEWLDALLTGDAYRKYLIQQQDLNDATHLLPPPTTERFSLTPLAMHDFDTVTPPPVCDEMNFPDFEMRTFGHDADVAAACRMNALEPARKRPDLDATKAGLAVFNVVRKMPREQRLEFLDDKKSRDVLYDEVFRTPGLRMTDDVAGVAASVEPPFPSTDVIPPSFRFLVHVTDVNPYTWEGAKRSPAADTRMLGRSLDQKLDKLGIFPGVYTTLVTDDNISNVETYVGKYLLVLSLDLLKQRNWHICLQDMMGLLGENTTLFPWQQPQIEEYIKMLQRPGVSMTGRSFNELIFHDSIPLGKFLVRVIELEETSEEHGSSKHQNIYKRIQRIPRQLKNLPLSELNPALPAYCFLPPNALKPEKVDKWARHVFYPPSSHQWREALYQTCRLSFNHHPGRDIPVKLITDAIDTKAPDLDKNFLLNQVNYMRANRDKQDFSALMGYVNLDSLRPPRPIAEVEAALSTVQEEAAAEVARREVDISFDIKNFTNLFRATNQKQAEADLLVAENALKATALAAMQQQTGAEESKAGKTRARPSVCTLPFVRPALRDTSGVSGFWQPSDMSSIVFTSEKRAFFEQLVQKDRIIDLANSFLSFKQFRYAIGPIYTPDPDKLRTYMAASSSSCHQMIDPSSAFAFRRRNPISTMLFANYEELSKSLDLETFGMANFMKSGLELLNALDALSFLGVVHGHITPKCLSWDNGNTVSISGWKDAYVVQSLQSPTFKVPDFFATVYLPVTIAIADRELVPDSLLQDVRRNPRNVAMAAFDVLTNWLTQTVNNPFFLGNNDNIEERFGIFEWLTWAGDQKYEDWRTKQRQKRKWPAQSINYAYFKTSVSDMFVIMLSDALLEASSDEDGREVYIDTILRHNIDKYSLLISLSSVLKFRTGYDASYFSTPLEKEMVKAGSYVCSVLLYTGNQRLNTYAFINGFDAFDVKRTASKVDLFGTIDYSARAFYNHVDDTDEARDNEIRRAAIVWQQSGARAFSFLQGGGHTFSFLQGGGHATTYLGFRKI